MKIEELQSPSPEPEPEQKVEVHITGPSLLSARIQQFVNRYSYEWNKKSLTKDLDELIGEIRQEQLIAFELALIERID